MKSLISLTSAIALPVTAIAGLASETASFGQAATGTVKGASPALCGAGDTREPGIQGDVPRGLDKWAYNCGVRLVGSLPLSGNVQGAGKCAYVRTRGENPMAGLDADRDGRITQKEWTDGKRDAAQFAKADINGDGSIGTAETAGQTINVIDVSDPAKPVAVRTVPVNWASESFRVVVNRERALLVSGSSVYDISDCTRPVLLGEIKWPQLASGVSQPPGGGGGTGMLPHDLRVNPAGTKVYAGGLFEVDITNLRDPASWKVSDLRCDIAKQLPGPWMAVHQHAAKYGYSLCEDAARLDGANYRTGGSGLQGVLLWPSLTHSPDVNAAGTRVYVANQGGGMSGVLNGGEPKGRIIDVSKRPVRVLGEFAGPGHGVDWFKAGGREFVAHSNEVGTGATGPAGGRGATGRGAAPAASAAPATGAPGRGGPSGLASSAVNIVSDTCKPYPRPTALGWGFEVLITDVTNPAAAREASMLRIAINDPEFCAARKASGRDPTVAYHLIDNPANASFAMVNFGTAGLRFFDIRNPTKPVEVAYFNHGVPVHAGVGYYDAARGLVYASGGGQFWVLELEPQVRAKLGI